MNVRRKGHNYERTLAEKFRQLGFKFCKTSRQQSRLLDDCQVDLCNIPYNVQAKKGYKRGINYSSLFLEIKEKLNKNFESNSELHSLPKIIFHSKNGRKKEENLVIMQEHEFFQLLEKLHA